MVFDANSSPVDCVWKLCENHQDGKTQAKWSCEHCATLPISALLRAGNGTVDGDDSASGGPTSGPLLLCDDCDGFMHLSAAQKSHNRELLRLGVAPVMTLPLFLHFTSSHTWYGHLCTSTDLPSTCFEAFCIF